MASSSSGSESAGAQRSSPKLSLIDLPLESQTQIIENVSPKSLFSLQLVSKHFHGLASSRIYRSLEFNLSHPDAPRYYRESHYRLADALQTFATSDHDYAQYVKRFQLRMSDIETEDAQRRIASRYHASEEPTMFLNMALLLMIKKARAMEDFSWDVPIELSPDVYEALSKVKSLQILDICLDIASITRSITMPHPSIPLPPDVAQQMANAQYFPPIPAATNSFPPSGSAKNLAPVAKSKITKMKIERRRFGNFSNLRELRIGVIDNLDCLDQIHLCLAHSSKTVRVLWLSLSPALVRKARKLPSNSQPGPSAVDQMDDEEGITEPTTPETNIPAPAVPNDADIKKERKDQESTLARVFGFERLLLEDKTLDKSLKATAKSVKLTQIETDPVERFKQQLLAVLKSPTLNDPNKYNVHDIVKNLRENLERMVSTKAPKSSFKPKPVKKAVAKKPKSAGAWAQPPFSMQQTSGWDPLPPLPVAGSSGQAGQAPNAFLPPPPKMDKNGNTILPDTELFHTLFGPGGSGNPPIGDMSASGQYLPSSSSQASNANYNNKPSSSSYSFALPKFPSSSQQLQFSHNTLPSSYSGSVSFPLSNILSNPNLLVGILPEEHNKKLQHLKDSIASYENAANFAHQNVGKPTSQTSSPLKSEDFAGVDSDSESSLSLDELDKPNDITQPNLSEPANVMQDQESDMGMDIDMEHPDFVGDSDDDDDAAGSEGVGMVEEVEEEHRGTSASNAGAQLPDSSKPTLKENVPLATDTNFTNNALMDNKKIPSATEVDGTHEEQKPLVNGVPKMRPDDIMQEYIRMTHGFSLEEFCLYLVPLKPSILAKALNISCLRKVVFYSVGPQGAFWTMLEKLLDQGSQSALQVICTDDVSNAFVRCVSKLSGLKQLHLMRRSTKDFDSTTSKAPATIDEIRKLALVKQLPTLESLSIVNYEDDKWDLNGKCLRLLAARGKKLKDLACGMDTTHFHVFIQYLPGMRSLEAVNLINIRSTERIATLNRECRKFIVDVLHYYPDLKLKYVAMSNLVYQFSSKPKISLPEWLAKQEQSLASRQGKGKGKVIERPTSSGSGAPFEADSEDLSDLEEARPNIYVAKHWRINEVPEMYTIFSHTVRKGKV